MPDPSLAAVGSLLGDPTRAGLLTMLLDGRARTVGELAREGGVAVSTTSGHLARLLDGRLVAVAQQGRHRYYRLAGPQVAAALEVLLALPAAQGLPARRAVPEPRVPVGLRFARTCYDHLAGTLAVALHDRLTEADGVGPPRLRLPAWTALGVPISPQGTGAGPARECLDWSERRAHLAGRPGTALLALLLERGWVTRRHAPRAVHLTGRGRDGLTAALGAHDSWAALPR